MPILRKIANRHCLALWMSLCLISGLSLQVQAQHSAQAEAGTDEAAAVWSPLLGKRLVNADGKKVALSELSGKKVGLLFSASWCPPCHAFMPKLLETYNELKKDGKAFEIVLVSHDQSEKKMFSYMREYEMPWSAVRFDDKARKALQAKYKIKGIPSLVILDETGKTLSENGYRMIATSGAAAFDQW